MESSSIHPPLSNVQAEMLKLFSADVPEKQLLEIKNMIARYLLDKARDNADDSWDKKGYSDESLKKMLEE
ncbi:MAG: hypothetical protein JNM88_15630 [Chitinophagaceae bacterium]|nr:hypothetical protein [Chitinophagaceae bacterium]